jgi:hypothetical protein
MKAVAILTALVFSGLLIVKLTTQNEVAYEEPIEDVVKPVKKPEPKKLKPIKKYPKKGRSSRRKSTSQKSLELKKIVKVQPRGKRGRPAKTKYDFKEFVYVDQNENLYVESVIVDGDDVVSFGDVLVGEKDDILRRAEKGESVSINKPVPWTNGNVPYIVSEELSESIDAIHEAMSVIQEATNGIVNFSERGNEENYLSFEKGNQNCYSYVGMRGGKQKVSLSTRCGVGEILHELIHALGFFHEQNREDRDQYLEVHFYNIDEKFHPQFKKIPNSWQHLFNTDFDFQSIMLYPPTAFSMYDGDYSMTTVEGDPYEKQVGILSESDINRIKMLYKIE